MTKARAKTDAMDPAEELKRWRELADEYINFFDDEADEDDVPKKGTRHYRRKVNIRRVAKLVRATEGPHGVGDLGPEKIAKHLAAFRALARAVIKDSEDDPPGWCDAGEGGIARAKRLLGIKIMKRVSISLYVDDTLDVDDIKRRSPFVTVATQKGEKVIPRTSIDSIQWDD